MIELPLFRSIRMYQPTIAYSRPLMTKTVYLFSNCLYGLHEDPFFRFRDVVMPINSPN